MILLLFDWVVFLKNHIYFVLFEKLIFNYVQTAYYGYYIDI